MLTLLERTRTPIPHDVFKKPFEGNPQPYRFPHDVTRANFMSFMLGSFRISKGIEEAQWLYMNWLGEQTHFDWKTTLSSFYSLGGWQRLNTTEQSMFVSAYKQNPNNKHQHNLPDQALEWYLGEKLNTITKSLLEWSHEEVQFKTKFPYDPKTMLQLNQHEFLGFLDNFIYAEKEKRRLTNPPSGRLAI